LSAISSPALKLRKTASRIPILKACYHGVARAMTGGLYAISPVLLARLRYLSKWHRLPDLAEPRLFDEKLLWLMLYWHHPLKTQCADKYLVRSYVKEHGLEDVLPRLYGVFQDSSEIDLARLPERFILKCTHGCKCNVYCRDKKSFDATAATRSLDSWLEADFSKVFGEVHYSPIKPRIICEEFLEDGGGELPADYKVYCFHGKAHCTLVCSGRTMNGTANYDFYDREWQRKLPYARSSLAVDRRIKKPAAYEEMIEAAEQLSQPFPFVRADFYSIKGRAVFGELTFTPCGCIDKDYTEIAERVLGSLIKLPDKYLDDKPSR